MTVCTGRTLTSEYVKSAVRHSDTAGVDYIPADINLANSETLMQTAISRETVLRRILANVECYDFVIIDCLPSLGTLLINALTAANKLLIPVQTQKFSLDGLQALNNLYEQIKTAINPSIILIMEVSSMNTIKKALKRIAYEFDVPLSEVQKEIQDIINEFYNSSDKEIHDRWRQICPNGEKPLRNERLFQNISLLFFDHLYTENAIYHIRRSYLNLMIFSFGIIMQIPHLVYRISNL